MEQIRYKSGEFQSFTATRTFALGNTNVSVQKDSDLEFDGSTVKYAGADYVFPQLRSAVKVGWVVLSSEYEEGNPEYGRPQAANIKVRSATEDKGEAKSMKAPVATETDERIVMSSADHAAGTKAHNTGQDVVEPQDGTSVGRRFKTSAKAGKTDVSRSNVVNNAENVEIEPGRGRSEQEMLAGMSDEERQIYLAKKESLKSRYVDTDISQGTPVAKVASKGATEKEGITVTQQVGGGVEIADMGGTGGKAEESVASEEGVTFRTTNGPKKLQPEPHPRSRQASTTLRQTIEARLQIAKTLCPEFPSSYDFAATERKKLARLQADFEDRPDVIRAVFAAESDEFKTRLVEEFPAAFVHSAADE